jgi:hypothetical protein
MHGPINVKSPNNIIKWQMRFNSAFKGLMDTGSSYTGVQRSRHDTGHPPPISADVNNQWTHTFTPPHACSVPSGTTKLPPLIYVPNKKYVEQLAVLSDGGKMVCITIANARNVYLVFGVKTTKINTLWLNMRHCFHGYGYQLFSPSSVIKTFRQKYERRNGTSGVSIMSPHFQ